MDYRATLQALSRRRSELTGERRAVEPAVLIGLLLARFIEETLCLPALRPDAAWHELTPASLDARFAFLNSFFETDLFPAGTAASGAETRAAQEAVRSLPGPLSVELLAYGYEQLFESTEAKRDGIFYTPRQVVEYIVEHACIGDHALVLDPACGSGLFLLHALRLLCARRRARTAGDRISVLRDCIFGVDKDARAAALTRLLLLFTLFEDAQTELFGGLTLPDLSQNIRAGNSLLDARDAALQDAAASAALSAFSWADAFPAAAANGGFDCIVGNPPYGLKRGDQLTAAENELLKRRYEEFRTGKVNKYLAFMARGVELLAPHGRLSFIVPNAWLGIQGGAALRRHLLRERCLERIVILQDRVFEHAQVEAVIFEVQAQGGCAEVSLVHAPDSAAIPAQAHFRVSAARCLKSPDARIPLFWCGEAEHVFDALDAACVPLTAAASGFVPLIALQAYAAGKGNPPQTAADVAGHVFHCKTGEHADAYPYLEGADVRRYALNPPASWLKHGPWLAEPQPLDRFTGPRVVLREILGPFPRLLTAAYAEETLLYNKSVLHIVSTGRARGPMLALLAVLNSLVAGFVIAFRGRKSQRRLFPKIVNEDLKDFPLPKDFAAHIPRLAELAAARLAAPPVQQTAVEEEIERAVLAAYGIDAELARTMSAALDRVAPFFASARARRG